jgi:hypothetical protein
MKKVLLSSFVMVLTVYAYGQGISGGLKAGMNLSNQKFTDSGISLDTKTKPGIHGGVFIVAMLNEKMGIQPEVLYSMQGSRWDIDGDDSKIKFDYITIPVLFRYNITEMISVHGGPQFGILTTAKVEFEDGEEEDLKDGFKGTDFAAAAGGEVDLPNGLGFGLRYVLGLSNVSEQESEFPIAEAKNRVIQIYVKYNLFGKK